MAYPILRLASVISVVAALAVLSCSRKAPEGAPRAATPPPEAAVAPSDPGMARNLEIFQTAELVVVGLREFDLLSARHPAMNATIEFKDAQGKSLGRHEWDFARPAARSHLVFEKRPGAAYHAASVVFRDGKQRLAEAVREFPAPSKAASAAPMSDEAAFVVRGARADAKAVPEKILLPDLAKAREVALPDAPRRWNLEGSVKRVVADFNFPSMGSLNYSVFSRQTSDPSNASLRSHYDSIKFTLYDPQTGEALSTLKGLVEIPLDENWRLGDEDLETGIPLEKLGVHVTTERVSSDPKAERITSNYPGGLMQGSYGVALDDDGNLYFNTEKELVRFNLKKAKFEKAPIHILEYATTFLPKLAEVPPAESAIKSIGWTGSAGKFILSYGGRGRLYVLFHDWDFDKGQLACSAVFSVPTTDWEDAEAFQQGCVLNAASWPTAKFPLYPTWLPAQGERRKLFHTLHIMGRVCMLSYDKNHFWVMDVDEAGHTTRLLKLTTLGGQKVNAMEHPTAAFAGDKYLGIVVPVEVGDHHAKMEAFLAENSAEFVVAPADRITSRQPMSYRSKAGARISSGTTVYGLREYPKSQIAEVFGKPDFGKGHVRVYYDVLARLKKHPEGLEEVLPQINGPSLGPQFLVAAIPGEGGTVLGVSEYGGYYFGFYGVGEIDAPTVRKTYLLADTKAPVQVASGARIGPYCHVWRKELGDDVLYFAGYTGIGRIRIRKEGQTLSRSNAEMLCKKEESLDGATPGYTKWFRDLIWGLGDKAFVTGVAEGGRGGTAFSGGLGVFHTGEPSTLSRLTAMSACHQGTRLDSRIVVGADGAVAQEIYLPANFEAGLTAGAKEVPSNQRPKIFVFRDEGNGPPRDLFGFSVAPAADEKARLLDYAVAQNQLYGIVVLSDGTLSTVDLQARRFVDCVRLKGRVLAYSRNVNALNPMPDGAHVLCSVNEAENSVTFHRVDADSEGKLRFEALLTCDRKRAPMFTGWQAGGFDFVPDSRNKDGSYDLVLGAGYPFEEGARLYVIPDVIPPRGNGSRTSPR
jgi:hypothetical protein